MLTGRPTHAMPPAAICRGQSVTGFGMVLSEARSLPHPPTLIRTSHLRPIHTESPTGREIGLLAERHYHKTRSRLFGHGVRPDVHLIGCPTQRCSVTSTGSARIRRPFPERRRSPPLRTAKLSL